MRRRLDFYDFALGNISILLLTLAVPALPRWSVFDPARKLAVIAMLLAGSLALGLFLRRPRSLQDTPTDHTDLFDLIIIFVGCVFVLATYGQIIRSLHARWTLHRLLITNVLALLSLFCFFCFLERGGRKKLSSLCFICSALCLMEAVWQLATGAGPSKRLPYQSIPKAESYRLLVFGMALLTAGIFADMARRHRDKS
jgi:hypothetical protein